MVQPHPEIPRPPARPRPRAPKPQLKVLASEMTRGTQSVELIEILEFKGHKLRLHIKSDSYKFQSYAIVSIFHTGNLKWNQLVSIPHGNMKTEEGICYYQAAQGSNPQLEKLKHKFIDDRESLIEKMKLIL